MKGICIPVYGIWYGIVVCGGEGLDCVCICYVSHEVWFGHTTVYVYLMYTSFNWSILCRLAQQLKSIVDQCESRESVGVTFSHCSALSLLNSGPLFISPPSFMQTFDKILQQKQLELQLAEAKLAQSRVAAAQEKETHETEKQLVSISLRAVSVSSSSSLTPRAPVFLPLHSPSLCVSFNLFFPPFLSLHYLYTHTCFTLIQCFHCLSMSHSVSSPRIHLSFFPTCLHATTVDGATARAPEKM